MKEDEKYGLYFIAFFLAIGCFICSLSAVRLFELDRIPMALMLMFWAAVFGSSTVILILLKK